MIWENDVPGEGNVMDGLLCGGSDLMDGKVSVLNKLILRLPLSWA